MSTRVRALVYSIQLLCNLIRARRIIARFSMFGQEGLLSKKTRVPGVPGKKKLEDDDG